MNLYSVVKTYQEGELLVVGVPDSWVDFTNNKLYYPPKKAAILRNKGGPPTSDFICYDCVVLYESLTKQQAYTKEGILSDMSDTDSSVAARPTPSKKLKTTNIDYNDQMNKIQKEHATVLASHHVLPINQSEALQSLKPRNVDSATEVMDYSQADGIEEDQVMGAVPIIEMLEDDDSLFNVNEACPSVALVEIQAIKDLESRMYEGQKEIFKQLDEIFRAFAITNSKIVMLIRKSSTSSEPSLSMDDSNDDGWNQFTIDTSMELDAFEAFLRNGEAKNKLVDVWLPKVPNLKKRQNVSVAYPLCDVWFSRELLNLYSWTGASRDKEKQKKNFSKFLLIHEVFGKLVRSIEPKFDLQKFFQFGVLKYSSARTKNSKSNAQTVDFEGKKDDVNGDVNHDESAGVNPEDNVGDV